MSIEAIGETTEGFECGSLSDVSSNETTIASCWGRDWEVRPFGVNDTIVRSSLHYSPFQCSNDFPKLEQGRVPSDNPHVGELRKEADEHRERAHQHAGKAAEEFWNGNFGTFGREAWEATKEQRESVLREQEANREAMRDWRESRGE